MGPIDWPAMSVTPPCCVPQYGKAGLLSVGTVCAATRTFLSSCRSYASLRACVLSAHVRRGGGVGCG
jgi:hypothetical protein